MEKKTRKILDIFEEISKIPRCSKNEEKICQWLQNWAKEKGFEYETDSVNNLLIEIPATKGYEQAPTVILQGHMDMVCEKEPDSTHDFSKDPIELVYDGDWLTANRTTLGADNGIAISMAIALAEDEEAQHPPLEFLFTIDEETGLTGANALSIDFLSGNILLNIDSEDEGVFTVGCAGGRDAKVHLPLNYEEIPKNFAAYQLKADGMKGGHSGVDINEHKANANKILARTLKLLRNYCEIRIVDMEGGTAHNAIPRDAQAILVFEPKEMVILKAKIKDFEKSLHNEYKGIEPNLELTVTKARNFFDKKSLTKQDTERVINLLLAFPHGVFEMSADIENLVETSNNLATMEIKDGSLHILSSQRSSVMTKLDEIVQQIQALGELAGAEIEIGEGYPGWQPNMDSPLLKRCVEVYEQIFGEEPIVEAIHAGLECGVIGAKYEEMDMISFGPTIKNPHSPDEKIEISSITKAWDFLVALLKSYS